MVGAKGLTPTILLQFGAAKGMNIHFGSDIQLSENYCASSSTVPFSPSKVSCTM